MEWNLKVVCNNKVYPVHFTQLEAWKDENLSVEEFAPGKKGEAVSFLKIIDELGISGNFSSVTFSAEDGFVQEVPFSKLQDAFLLFKEKGEMLKKSFPVRLFVPGSDSDCINVKSVVTIEIH